MLEHLLHGFRRFRVGPEPLDAQVGEVAEDVRVLFVHPLPEGVATHQRRQPKARDALFFRRAVSFSEHGRALLVQRRVERLVLGFELLALAEVVALEALAARLEGVELFGAGFDGGGQGLEELFRGEGQVGEAGLRLSLGSGVVVGGGW